MRGVRGRRKNVLLEWVVEDPSFPARVEASIAQVSHQLPAGATIFKRLEYAQMALRHVGQDIERSSRSPPPALEPALKAHWLSAARASSLRGDVCCVRGALGRVPEAAMHVDARIGHFDDDHVVAFGERLR